MVRSRLSRLGTGETVFDGVNGFPDLLRYRHSYPKRKDYSLRGDRAHITECRNHRCFHVVRMARKLEGWRIFPNETLLFGFNSTIDSSTDSERGSECVRKNRNLPVVNTHKAIRRKPMLEMKAFSRASLAMVMSIAFLSFVETGVAQEPSKTTKSLPTLDSSKVEDVGLMTRAQWVAEWYFYPKHLQPTVSLYGYRHSDVKAKCSSSSNNNVGMVALVWDKDKTVANTRKLTGSAGLVFISHSMSYTVEDICSSSEPSKPNEQTENQTEEPPSLFVITQKPIPNVWPTHRYVVEKKRKTGQGH